MDHDVETLLFAVYFAAIVSLTDQDCQEKFSETKILLLQQYRHALEQCLVRSNFLDTPRMISLQAFVLYTTTARDAPMAAPMDALLAIATRLAMKLDLHQEQPQNQQQSTGFITIGDKTSLEMHRRLWWHIISLDVQRAEEAGTDPTILDCTWNTKLPENLDDAELDAGSRLPLPPRPGQTFDPDFHAIQNILNDYVTPDHPQRRTDMTYILTRMEISHALRRLNFSSHFCNKNGYGYLSTNSSRLEFLDRLSKKLRSKYIQYCQRNDFLSFFARNATNLILSKQIMLVNRTEGSAQESLRNCTRILEAAVGLRKTQPQWAWSLRCYVEMDVLEVLLQLLTEVPVEAAGEDGAYEAPLQHCRLLAQAAVERGREHTLQSYYPAVWKKIERHWSKIEDRDQGP